MKEEEKAEDLLRLEGSQSSVKGSKDKLSAGPELKSGSQEGSKAKQPMLNIHRYFKRKSPSKEKIAGAKDQEPLSIETTEAYRIQREFKPLEWTDGATLI